MKDRASSERAGQAFDSEGTHAVRDQVAVEEPLEIRVASERVSTTLRTPGLDGDLALGFLYAEGVVQSADDVGRVAHCGRPDESSWGNVIDVTPGPGVSLDIDRAQRSGLTSAACGVCGRDSIEELMARCEPVPEAGPLDARLLQRAAEALAGHQPGFARTGGLHAALALAADGSVVAAAEDIGRHNAVDKVVGALLRRGLMPRARAQGAPLLLMVSGRAGFEIAQKAVAAGFAVLGSVSAASQLAIDTAEAGGLTLAAFVRDGRFTLYTHLAGVTRS